MGKFNIGDYVRINKTNNWTGYNQIVGKCGKVVYIPQISNLGIHVNNYINPHRINLDIENVFWINKSNVDRISKREYEQYLKDELKNKNESDDIMKKGYLKDYDKIVKVQFPDQHTEYCAVYDKYTTDIKSGDYVIIKDNYNASPNEIKNLHVGIVVGLGEDIDIYLEVVCKCDLTKYFDECNRLKKIGELKDKMDQRIHEIQTTLLYSTLAEKDQTLRDLLEEYNKLQG